MAGVIIVGVGPGIGLSVAKRFAREQLPVGLVARSATTVGAAETALADTGVPTVGVTADAGDESALPAALDQIVERFGVPDALVYNAAIIQGDAIGELSARQHLDAWAVNVVGAITAAAHLGPQMEEAGHGTILITGGMPRPLPDVTSLSLGKAGVRALSELLAARFAPSGVHVATVTVGGTVAPGTAFDPDDIAEQYWRLHSQQAQAWEREVVYTGEPEPSPATENGRPRILLLSGSLRTGSTNAAVLQTARAVAPGDVTTLLYDGMAGLPHFNPDDDREGISVPPTVATLRAHIRAADALLVCTPEYAGALPGALKNLLEWTVGDAGTYGKPVAWINAAGPAAPTGAADAHQSLRTVLGYVGAEVVEDACLRIPVTRASVGEDGVIADPSIRTEIARALTALVSYEAVRGPCT